MRTILMLALTVGLPLVGKPNLLLSWPILFLSALGIFLNLSRPTNEARPQVTSKRDQISKRVMVFSVLLCFSIPIFDYAYVTRPQIEFAQVTTVLGFILISIGILMKYWCMYCLKEFFVEDIQVQKNHKIIQQGPYRFLRHPSYLGAWLRLFGISIFMQCKMGVMWIIFIVIPIYAYRIFLEELMLSQSFGAEYKEYQKNTWKVLPYIF